MSISLKAYLDNIQPVDSSWLGVYWVKMGLLKGRTVDLKLVEKEELKDWEAWLQDPDFRGALEPYPRQISLADAEKEFLTPSIPGLEFSRYFIQKKDAARIGIVIHFNPGPLRTEIGYILKETARGQGSATEAASIIVDYLFLSRNLERVQAHTVVENTASQRVLERIGFKKEGELRHAGWLRGRWVNYYSWSILRSEWANPKILKATQS